MHSVHNPTRFFTRLPNTPWLRGLDPNSAVRATAPHEKTATA